MPESPLYQWEIVKKQNGTRDAKKEEVVINNTPLTPRKRGVEFASSENYSLALELWRSACDEAGLAFIVDNCTANGARKVAARYLDTGILTPEAVGKAMRRLAQLITRDEKARHYTLNALGNNISRYLEAMRQTSTAPPSKRIAWRFVCDICGVESVGMFPPDVTPEAAPCLKAKYGRCSGTAHPRLEDGTPYPMKTERTP